MQNAKGRLAEAYTLLEPAGTLVTDEGFSYTSRGELSDYYQSSPNSGGFYHTVQSYWPNGALASISGVGLPIINYGDQDGSGLDVMGNVKTVTASAGINPVSAAIYNVYNDVTSVTFGSSDVATFVYDVHGQMAKYEDTINGTVVSGAPSWNANGSLKQLTIVDPLNAGDAQICKYTLDDLSRLSSVKCGTAWGQTFGYDAFGNIAKAAISGSAGQNFQASYNNNNQIAMVGSVVPVYDANGNLKSDGFHSYTWNADNRPVTIDSATLTYDAFGHVVEKTDSGVDNEYVYLAGRKLAVMDGQVQKNAYVPLPGGTQAVYASGTLSFYQVPDWQGSYRIASTQGRALKFSQAFAPFGETYALSGTGSRQSFAGMESDIQPDLEDALFREEHTTQGRWISPDPAGLNAVDLANPQSWNRYAYVLNNPLRFVDPLGLDCSDSNTVCVTAPPPPDIPLDDSDFAINPHGVTQIVFDWSNFLASIRRGVHKKFPPKPHPFNCNIGAAGVMQQVQSNFSQFGNYTGNFGPLGMRLITADVTFGSGLATPVSQGSTISISDINRGPDDLPMGTFNVSVTVASVSPTSFTFTTTPGHVLYPASIGFSASDAGSAQINFSIQVNGDYAGVGAWFGYYAGGYNLESNIWNHFISNVEKVCAGQPTGPG